jgi:hypothetical protein ELI_2923
MKNMTEDEVRDYAGKILGFEDSESTRSGVGQLTTFNQLGFKGIADKPDGWYLPNNKAFPAIILEVKSTNIELNQKQIDEIIKNCIIAMKKYKNVIGILYNGIDVKVYKNLEEIKVTNELQNKEYYLSFFNDIKIDKQRIYQLTKKINDTLHTEFGIKNLYHRMIFTACALVAKRYGASLVSGMNYETFHTSIHSTLAKSLENSKRQNQKLDLLLEVYAEIKMNSTENQEAIDNFIEWVSEISDCINSDNWNGEDVMGIFFNEFNRYKKKSESGQVFTPDHITSLMYRLINVDKDDCVLDAACGSGAFLVKAMCNMIKEAGGVQTNKAKDIKSNQLYGIELDREIYALACANMLIHKDGKTNLEHLDSRMQTACEWIASKPITKVLMNPPFETKYGCSTIVENVLDNVNKGTLCAFILPDKKLEKISQKQTKRILLHHTIRKIIKLPEKLFVNTGVMASIFIFEAGVPQNEKEIFACYISDDGLVTVKNQGRQDVYDKWDELEDYWVDVIHKQSGDETIQWIDSKQHLSYQMPKVEFKMNKSDFRKSILDYMLFKKSIDVKELQEKISNTILYGDNVEGIENELLENWITQKDEMNEELSVSEWKEFEIKELFETSQLGKEIQVPTGAYVKRKDLDDGDVPRITVSGINNGVTGWYSSNDSNYKVYNNFISVSFLNTVFYQEGDASLDMKVHCLKPKDIELNKYVALFLVSVIRKTIYFSSYADQISSTVLPQIRIKLPVESNGNPDYEYMENYIKSLPYGDII